MKLRSNVAAQFILGTTLATLFGVMFNPILTPIIGAMAIPWLLWRFHWLIPFALIIAFGFDAILAGVIKLLTRLPALTRARKLLLVNVPMIFIIALGIGLRPNIDSYLEILKDLTLRVYPTPNKLFAQLDAETTQDGIGVVLADQIVSIALPAYMSSAKIVAHRSLTTSELFPARLQDVALQRLIDQYQFSQSSFLNESVLNTLHQYNIRYLIVASGTDLDLELHLAPQWFERQIEDQSFTLYKVLQIPPVTATIQGETAMENRQWDAGRQKFEEALQQNPNDAMALMGLSEFYRLSGDYPGALSRLQQVAALTDAADLHNRLGQLYAQMGEYDKAIPELDKAQQALPDIANYHLDMGNACLATGNRACAEQQFQADVDAQGQTDPATKIITLAGLWSDHNDSATALKLYEQAVDISPSIFNKLILASAYQKQKMYDKARPILLELRRENPASADVLGELANLETAQGNYDQAAAWFDQSIQLRSALDQDTTGAHLGYGQAMLQANRFDVAQREAQKALALQPNNASGYVLQGSIYNLTHQFDQAIANLQHAIQIDPTAISTYTKLGEQYRSQAAPPDESVDVISQASSANPNEATPFISLGDQLQRRGNVAGAISAYQTALDMLTASTGSVGNSKQKSAANNQSLVYSRLGAIYEDQGQISTAMIYYNAAVSASPTRSASRANLAEALRRRNDVTGAEALYRQIIHDDPTFTSAYLKLAELLTSQGDTKGADDLNQQALAAVTKSQTAPLTQGEKRQQSQAYTSVGNFYAQTRQPTPNLSSAEDESATALPAPVDPVSQKAIETFDQSLAVDDTLAATQGLARLYQELGQTDKAIQVYQDQIKKGTDEHWPPQQISGYYVGLGEIYLGQKQYDQAITAYQQAISYDGYAPGPRLGLSRTLYEKGDKEGAFAQNQIAVNLAPGSVEAQLGMASALEERGESDKALGLYQSVAQAHPGDLHANLQLGQAWQKRNEPDKAAQAYQQAVAMTPGNADAHLSLGTLDIQQARFDEAEKELQQAVKLDYKNTSADLKLADLLIRFTRYDEAKALYQKTIETDPTNWRAYSGLAGLDRNLGDITQAIDNLKKAAAADKTEPSALMELSSIYQEQNQPDLAEQMQLAAIDRAPNDANLRVALAEFYQGRGLPEEALLQMQKAVEANPNSVTTLVAYANELRLLGRDTQAETFYQRSAQATQPGVDGYRALAEARESQGRRDEAFALLDKAIAYSPNDAASWLVKGQFQLRAGDLITAQATIQKASELGPAEGQIWQELGNIYLSNGKSDQAISAYKQSMKVQPTYLPAYGSLIKAYEDLKQSAEITNVATLARQAVPGSYLANIFTANAFEDVRQWDQARTYLSQAVTQAPGIPETLIASGELELRTWHPDKAFEVYVQATKIKPGEQKSNLSLIDALVQYGYNDEALKHVQETLQFRPGDNELQLRLGKVQRNLGNDAEAETAFRRSAELNRADGKPYAELGAMYSAQGRFDKAVEAYNTGISLQRGEDTYYIELSQLWRAGGQADKAIGTLQDGLVHATKTAPLYDRLSGLYLELGQPASAYNILQEGIKKLGEDYQLLQSLGSYYQSQAQYSAAEQTYRKIIAQHPDQSIGYSALANLYLARSQTQNALTYFRKSLDLDPLNAAGYLELGDAYRQAAQSGLSAYYFQQALQSGQSADKGYRSLSSLYLAEGLPDEARKNAESGLKIAPLDPASFVAIGNARLAASDEAGAIDAYQQAIDVDATRIDGYTALSAMYAGELKYDQAITATQQAIRRAPLDWSLWESLGGLYAQANQSANALSAYNQAIAMNSTAVSPWISKGDLYNHDGNFNSALDAYQHAHQMQPNDSAPLISLANLYRGRATAADKGAIYVREVNFTQAESYARQAIALNTYASNSYMTLADILRDESKYDEALDNYMTAIRHDAHQLSAYTAWIDLHTNPLRHRGIDKSELKANLASIAGGAEGDSLWAHVMVGLGYQRIDYATDQAVSNLERAQVLDPAFSQLYRELAKSYAALLQGRPALSAWYRFQAATAPRIETETQNYIEWLLQVRIDTPRQDAYVSGQVNITGTADRTPFQFYKLEYQPVNSTDDKWFMIGEAVYHTVDQGQLGTWLTSQLPAGEYRIRLTVVDPTGNYSPSDEITVTVK